MRAERETVEGKVEVPDLPEHAWDCPQPMRGGVCTCRPDYTQVADEVWTDEEVRGTGAD